MLYKCSFRTFLNRIQGYSDLQGICRTDKNGNPLWIIEYISGKKYALKDVSDFSLSDPIDF